MSIQSDKWIIEQCQGQTPMIKPFSEKSVSRLPNGRRVSSSGVSSYGYDLSLGSKFKELRDPRTMPGHNFIDPCNPKPELYQDVYLEENDIYVLRPRGFALGVTREFIDMPHDIFGVCMEKSTLARSALGVTVTPIEPGWCGYLTLELHNHTDFPIHLTPGMGITQLLFFKGEEACQVSYAARSGKYQNQPAEPVIARAKEKA